MLDFIRAKHGNHRHEVLFAQSVKQSEGYELLRTFNLYSPSTTLWAVRTPNNYIHDFPSRKAALEVYGHHF